MTVAQACSEALRRLGFNEKDILYGEVMEVLFGGKRQIKAGQIGIPSENQEQVVEAFRIGFVQLRDGSYNRGEMRQRLLQAWPELHDKRF